MILLDTSVWIDHLRGRDDAVVRALDRGEVMGHPWVRGELALGRLFSRDDVLGALGQLPQAEVATHAELMLLIEEERLYGRGIGYVDAGLLAATRLTADAALWTRDKRLRTVAIELGCDAGRA